MALIACSKCGRQISSFAKACPACGTPPQISTVPPPLPVDAARAKGIDPRAVKLAIVIGFVLLAVIAGQFVSKTESSTTSASSSARIPATPPQHFPRAPQYYPRVPQHFPRAIPVQPAPVTYRVVKISQGDHLNVRAGAGSTYPIVMTLDPGTGGIVLGANRAANAETMWQEIIVNGRTGLVNADFIAPATQPSASP